MAAINRLMGPSGAESPMVITGPSSEPAVPPAPMKPNRRLPCSLVKRSAMNDQNTATAKRLNTLTQTKKTRATMMVATPLVSSSQNSARLATKKMIDEGNEQSTRQPRHHRPIERLCPEKRHEGRGEHPRQSLDTAGDAHLVPQWSQHVIARQEGEEVGEGPQHCRVFLRRGRYRPPEPALEPFHGANDSFCLSSATVTGWPQPGSPRWNRRAPASLPTTTGSKPPSRTSPEATCNASGPSPAIGTASFGSGRFASRTKIMIFCLLSTRPYQKRPLAPTITVRRPSTRLIATMWRI